MTLTSCRAGLVLTVVLLAAATPAAAQMPLPKDDPFYVVPKGLGKLRSGKILKARPVEVSAQGRSLDAAAWQLQYRSLDAHDRPTAMVTTVMVPDEPWTGKGPRPLVSYQVAEDSADTKCAVSYALSGGVAAGLTQSNASQETGTIGQALDQGWAVVASDYEGPKASFFAAPEEAHGVLDGIRAALSYRKAGISKQAPLGMWGYSGGGYATAVAALAHKRYAPELRFAGAAIGAPTASVEAEVIAFSGSVAGGAIAMAIAALDRAYPEVRLTEYLNDTGKRAVAASAHDCLIEAAERHPMARYEDWQVRPNTLDDPTLDRFLRSISPLYMRGHPRFPVLHYHDETDEFAPIGPAREMFAKWCRRGTVVESRIEPLGEHIEYQARGASTAIAYLNDRFAGVPAPSTC